MFEVNLKIISELKAFVQICASDPEVLSVLRSKDKDFTRNRKLSLARLILFICKLCKRTLSVELDQFFESDLSLDHTCTVGAFSQQRKKLAHLFFQLWNEVLYSSFYHYAEAQQQVKRWRGYRLIAADGSGVSLISTRCLNAHFGGQRNPQGSFTGAKAFFHYDVLNRLFIYSRLAPYRTAELDMAWAAMDGLQPDTICIYDRNFSNYKTIALHLWTEESRRFVIRAREHQRIVRDFLRTGLVSQTVLMYPPGKQAIEGLKKAGFIITPRTGLKVRMVRVELKGGKTEVLFTNLWDEEGYGSELFKELYFMRWGIETGIGIAKNLLQLESFSALSVESVYQDFYATIFMTNLSALLVRQAEQEQVKPKEKPPKKWPMQVNMNKASGRLRTKLVSLFISDEPGAILLGLADYFGRHIVPVRKGRSFERKRKNKQSFSKHKTFTNYKPAA